MTHGPVLPAAQGADTNAPAASVAPALPLAAHVVLLALCALGVGLFMYATQHGGVITTADSAMYISAARSTLDGDGMLDPDGQPFVRWVPVLPLIYAGLDVLTGAPADTGAILEPIRWLNAVTFALIVYLCGRLLWRLLAPDWGLMLLGVVIVGSAWPVWLTLLHAWSEPLYLVFTLALVLWLPHVLTEPTAWRMVGAGALVGLATLERYVGMTLIMAGTAVIVFAAPVRAWRARLWYAFVFGAMASAPVLLWMLGNYVRSGTTSGREYVRISAESIASVIDRVGGRLTFWFFGREDVGWLAGYLLVGLLVAYAVGVWWRMGGRLAWRDTDAPTHDSTVRIVRLTFALMAAYIVVYIVFFIASAITTTAEIQPRMFTTIYPLAVGVALVALRDAAGWAARQMGGSASRRQAALGTLGAALVLWSAFVSSVRVQREIVTLATWCCYDSQWADAGLVAWLRLNPEVRGNAPVGNDIDGVLWSNEPYKLHIYTGLRAYDIDRSPLVRDGRALTYILFEDDPDLNERIEAQFDAEVLYLGEEAAVYRLRAKDSAAG